jgi:hypothetical protein
MKSHTSIFVSLLITLSITYLLMKNIPLSWIQECCTGELKNSIGWLSMLAVLTLLIGMAVCQGKRPQISKIRLKSGALWVLILVSPIGYTTPDYYADITGDVLVNNHDISKLSSCFAQDPLRNPDCAVADVDSDGDIDRDDFAFISNRLGQAYPWTLYSLPVLVSKQYLNSALGDMNGDGNLDIVGVDKAVGHHTEHGLTVLLGLGNGRFQKHFYSSDYSSLEVVLGDVNGDGMLDAVIDHRDTEMAVLLGDGEGGFFERRIFSTGITTDYNNIALTLRDVNGDDVLDVVASNKQYFGKISVLLGSGDGDFQEPTQVLSNIGNDMVVALGDVSGDDKLDFVIASRQTGAAEFTVSVLPGNGDGSFQTPQVVMTNETISGLTLNDVNQDGHLDILASNTSHDEVWIMLNNGQGGFLVDQRIAVDGQPDSIILGDVNGDNRLDVLVFHQSNSEISILLANSNGRFQKHQHLLIPVRVLLGDVNNDGNLDLVSSTILLFGEGNGSFQTPKPIGIVNYSRSTAAIADLNGDTKLDLLIFNSQDNNISVRFGNGDGSFQDARSFPMDYTPRLINLDDIDKDGHLDLIVFHGTHYNISILLGDGNGGFQASRRIATDITDSYSILRTLGDMNGDGHLDVVVNGVNVVLGNGDGSFQIPQNIDIGVSSSLRAANDMDGDGVLDLIILNPDEDGFGHKGTLLLNNGDGSFRTAYHFELLSNTPTMINDPLQITTADLNGDRRKDIIVGFTTPLPETTIHRMLISKTGGGYQEQLLNLYSEYGGTTLLSIDDANGDSIPDIMLSDFRYTYLLLGNGDGSFRKEQIFGVSRITSGDLDGDNRPDILGKVGKHTVIMFNRNTLLNR